MVDESEKDQQIACSGFFSCPCVRKFKHVTLFFFVFSRFIVCDVPSGEQPRQEQQWQRIGGGGRVAVDAVDAVVTAHHCIAQADYEKDDGRGQLGMSGNW